jgi:glycosyltransferase involved in cell wall biosynthesis
VISKESTAVPERTSDQIPRRDRPASLSAATAPRVNPPPPHSTYRVRLRLSVILPFYNEAAIAADSAATVLAFAATHPEFHFVCVDDGSTDETARILQEHMGVAGRSGVELLRLQSNQGKGGAVKAALARCTGDAVCFLDGDLAYTLDHLYHIDRALTEHHIVIGSRILARGRGGSAFRRVYGSAFNFLVRQALGLPFRDTQAGLKGFRREVAEHLFGLQRVPGFAFDVELLFLARKFGYRVAEIPAWLCADHAYKTSWRRMFVHGARTLRELAQVRRNDRLGLYDGAAPTAHGSESLAVGRNAAPGVEI